jgi:hypothetical protein
MRSRSYRCVPIAWLCLALAPGLLAQDQEQPRPLTLGAFETQGSVTAGYRFTDFRGRQEKFLELFDLQKGFRLMDFNLMGRAKEGVSPFADSYSLDVSGLGGDPFAGGQFTLRKDKLYDLRINYRQSYYYWDQNDSVIPPAPSGQPALHNLTTNHNWATVRRFGSANLTVHATNNLRFLFEYNRTSRDGVNFTTRTLDYFGSDTTWGAFVRANPYYVEAPIDDTAQRFTGGISYTWRDWSFHYRLGYQTFNQILTWHNVSSPERSIYVDSSATNNEEVTSASWSESRRLKTPISEFSYTGKVTRRLDVRGGYIFYRYRGPATLEAVFDGNARTNSGGTAFAPYTVSMDSRANLTEPNHVLDEGFTLKIKDWWNLHADYRYSRSTLDSRATFHSLRDGTTANDGEVANQWLLGTHLLDVNMEFLPTRSLVVRPGIRYLKRDIEVLEDGQVDDMRTRRIKTVWPTLSVFYQPSRMFSVRGDLQSTTSGASYTRISPHTDVGSRLVFRFRPSARLSVEDNLIIRNRKLLDTDFRNSVRLNAFTVSYALDERFSIHGGLSYDSFFGTASVTFLRGTAPRDVTWRDQTVSRVWQAGVAAKPHPNLGVNLSGNFVRTTGAGEISGEPPYFGPMTWPLATGTVYYDFPKLGRLSLDLQRTYYLEEIVRGNDFQANLLTIRWTRDF